MDISVIVPVYNGEKTLGELNKRIVNELTDKFSFEIIYVFDFGRNKSWQIIEGLIQNNPVHIRGFHLKKNYGQHNALLFGMTKAQGELIITIDEDLQHDPKFIYELINEQKRGDFDVVYGKFEKLSHPGLRVSTSELLRKLLKVTVPGIYPDYSPYRLIKRPIAEKLTGLKNSYTFIDGYIGWCTDRISCVSIKHNKRADGVSSYSYFKLFKHALFISVAYTRVKAWILSFALFFNLLATVLLLIRRGTGSDLYTKSIAIMFFTGIFLLILGLISELIHYRALSRNSKPVELE